MTFSISLRGAGGEPVDLRRTFLSHGVADLPPMRVDASTDGTFEVTLPVDRARPRIVRVRQGRGETAVIDVVGPPPGPRIRAEVVDRVRHILRLDEDLSGFYRTCSTDPDLRWACAGAGRMMRNPTVFEEVVKTICTTNCSWALTRRMVTSLVEHLGEPAVGAPGEGVWGRAFPTPEAMAAVDETFYRGTVRAGYRAPYMVALARTVADGGVDVEELGREGAERLPDDAILERLLALPGVGHYAAAHIMMMLGRYSMLILDSWTRPTYARLVNKKKVADSTIRTRFRPYGKYAGLAFWLFLTRDWVEDPTGGDRR